MAKIYLDAKRKNRKSRDDRIAEVKNIKSVILREIHYDI